VCELDLNESKRRNPVAVPFPSIVHVIVIAAFATDGATPAVTSSIAANLGGQIAAPCNGEQIGAVPT
jgi:hypothetical protein